MEKLKAEETLENPFNGCRRCKAKAESLRQKDRANADRKVCIPAPELLLSSSVFY